MKSLRETAFENIGAQKDALRKELDKKGLILPEKITHNCLWILQKASDITFWPRKKLLKDRK